MLPLAAEFYRRRVRFAAAYARQRAALICAMPAMLMLPLRHTWIARVILMLLCRR